MITYSENYLYGFETKEIDNQALYGDCIHAEKIILRYFPQKENGWYGNKTSAANQQYNLLTFPSKHLNQLYHLLVKHINPLLEQETTYMIKSWMNVYRKGDQVSMHRHWPSECKAWHGFYCVNVGENESETIYKIPNIENEIHITSKNGLIVIGKSDGDRHGSSAWTKMDNFRITLAFDIVPVDFLNIDHINHFIPFKFKNYK